MKDFFRGVRKHIGKLDAAHLREQYELVADELARSEMLLHALNEGIVVLDRKGNVVRANPAAKTLFGMDPADALATLPLTLGVASKTETTLTYPEPRTLELQTIPLGEETIVKIDDVSAQRQRTEEELAAGATRAVRDLAAGVAHEIGNPLNAIAMNVQLLERDPTDVESIEIIKNQVKRLDGIVREFLEALRPSRPNLAPGSIADPLKNCLAAMRRQFEDRSIRVTLDIPSALPAVALDAGQIEQVFFNLVKNALEAMKDGSELQLKISSDDRDVAVEVRDTGLGMEPEQLAHLFEPYRTTKAKGTGLGLMISKRIVTDHGGVIAAASTPGVGTTFTIRLPRLEKRVRELFNTEAQRHGVNSKSDLRASVPLC